MLGISPSTYDYYESGRVPPADILVAIADAGNADLRWLITGHSAGAKMPPKLHPVVQRAAELLADRPDAAAALAAFLDILAESSHKLPDTPAKPHAEQAPATPKRKSWIPVLGRSAAGVAQFWSAPEQAEGVTKLMDRVGRYVSSRSIAASPAEVEGIETSPDGVHIVTLDESQDDQPVQFVAADDIKNKWPDAFAVQIDGESMAPEIHHGDLVLLSPSEPAIDGRPAVVQLAGQIGVTCKLYRRNDSQVHLTPANELFSPQVFPAESVQWALRVLAKVHPK